MSRTDIYLVYNIIRHILSKKKHYKTHATIIKFGYQKPVIILTN